GGLAGLTRRSGDKQVEITGGVAATAQGTGGSDALEAGECEKVGGEVVGGLLRVIDAEAAGAAAVVLDAFFAFFELLLSHAGELFELAGLDGRVEQGN